MERWLPVVGFEDYYEVSDLGLVKSLARVRPYRDGYRRVPAKMLSLIPDNTKRPSYVRVGLYLDGTTTWVRVHTLVLEAFKGPRPAGQQARHLNGIRDDNRPANLEWGTVRENCDDQLRHGTRPRGMARAGAKLRDADIPLIRAANAAGTSQNALARQYSVTLVAIQQVLNGKTWSHV